MPFSLRSILMGFLLREHTCVTGAQPPCSQPHVPSPWDGRWCRRSGVNEFLQSGSRVPIPLGSLSLLPGEVARLAHGAAQLSVKTRGECCHTACFTGTRRDVTGNGLPCRGIRPLRTAGLGRQQPESAPVPRPGALGDALQLHHLLDLFPSSAGRGKRRRSDGCWVWVPRDRWIFRLSGT